MSEFDDSGEIRESISNRVLEELKDGQTARLYLKGNTKRPFSYFWSSNADERGTKMEERRLLGACEKKSVTILVEDVETAPIMQRLDEIYFRSCLIVSVVDTNGVVIGAILLTSDEPKSFEEDDKGRWGAVANELSENFKALTRVELSDSEAKTFISLPIVRVLAVLIVLIAGMWYLAPKSQAPTKVRLTSVEVAQHFKEALVRRDYTSAWVLLEPNLRGRWPGSEFKQALEAWASSDKNREILSGRTITPFTEDGDIAMAVIPAKEDQGEWRWTLAKQGEQWYISRVEGGPATSPLGD